MTRLYISGPVSGIEHDNYDAFSDASYSLRAARYDVTVPHHFVKAGDTHEAAMLLCVHELMTYRERDGHEPKPLYDGVALLPGWEQSEGARLEKAVSEACGIPCKTVDEWLEEAR